jgi:carboxylesterase type B
MVCFLMSSPLAHGLFQQAIMESLGCADTISPELKTPSRYEGGVGTAEEIGLRLMRDLGIADGPDALQTFAQKARRKLRLSRTTTAQSTSTSEASSTAGLCLSSLRRPSHKAGRPRCQ